MKKYEKEALLKSFLLFFVSLGIFLGLLYTQLYKEKIANLDQDLFTKMRFCSFDLKCSDFKIDFVPKDKKKPLFLYHDKGGVEAYFLIPNSSEYYMKLSYAKEKYLFKKHYIKVKMLLRFLLMLLVVALLSLLFSFYALYPMKRALVTIEEFIKDILHDFNTPISSIVLNASLLKKDDKNREKVTRIDQSAQRILSLQENLKSYLLEIKKVKEVFDLKKMIEERKESVQKLYPDIVWDVRISSIMIETHKPAFERILVNLLTNAAKYNKKNGTIRIWMTQNFWLKIEDTGRGIKDTKMIFERFYTESSRGTGIGLHIVRKLCDELKIDIKVTSQPDKGTLFMLNLRTLTER